MKTPPHILLTALKLPDRPVGPISVRSDLVLAVERVQVKSEEKAVGGAARVAKIIPGVSEGTCIHLQGGGNFFVEESVEEVHGHLARARRWFA